MRTRIISILLTIVMMFGVLPQNALQAQAEEQYNYIEKRSEGNELELPVVIEDLSVYEASLSLRRTSPANKEDWERYSSDYLYEKLTDEQKLLYDRLEQMCLYYATGAVDIEYNERLQKYSMPGVAYENLDEGALMQVIYVYLFQNPQYYFLDKGYVRVNSTTNTVALTVYKEFSDGNARSLATDTMFSKVEEWLDIIDDYELLEEREKVAHDLIIQAVRYETSYFDQSAYSVFVGDKTVCAGYAQAFLMLMNASGIETIATTSTAHEWNKIELYGEWYNVDCTWDDWDGAYGKDGGYMFFNRSDDFLLEMSEDSRLQHTEETEIWGELLPEAAQDSGATYDSTGMIRKAQVIAAKDLTLVYGDSSYIEALSDDAESVLTYASSDEDIVTVDKESGLITATGVGEATVVVTASMTASSNQAQKTILITVQPQQIENKSLTSNAAGSILVKWQKTEGATNYQIVYSESEDFAVKTNVYVKSVNGAMSKKISGLKSGKTYYVKIRAYKTTDSGKKIYGAWSTVDSIKTQ